RRSWVRIPSLTLTKVLLMRDFSTSGDDARIAPWHVPLDTVLGHDASESFFRWRRTRGKSRRPRPTRERRRCVRYGAYRHPGWDQLSRLDPCLRTSCQVGVHLRYLLQPR